MKDAIETPESHAFSEDEWELLEELIRKQKAARASLDASTRGITVVLRSACARIHTHRKGVIGIDEKTRSFSIITSVPGSFALKPLEPVAAGAALGEVAG